MFEHLVEALFSHDAMTIHTCLYMYSGTFYRSYMEGIMRRITEETEKSQEVLAQQSFNRV
jgi:hypothetical protein